MDSDSWHWTYSSKYILWIVESIISVRIQNATLQKCASSPCRNFNRFRVFFGHVSQFWLGFIMVVYQKMYFKAYTNDLHISHKYDIAQLYFILGRAELHWNFSSILKDDFDIHRFSNRKWVLTMCTVGNLWKSEASLSQLEKFRCSSAPPNIK